MKINGKDFSIEHQFEQYLQRAGLAALSKVSTQYVELKKAFFGAWGQNLIQIRNDIGELEEREAFEVWESQLEEVSSFYEAQLIDYAASVVGGKYGGN